MKDEEYGYFILGERDKNGNDTIIPLFKFLHALKIMEKYSAEEKSEMVFGLDTFIEEPVYNRNLKEIGKMAVIQKLVYNKQCTVVCSVWSQDINCFENAGTYQGGNNQALLGEYSEDY